MACMYCHPSINRLKKGKKKNYILINMFCMLTQI